MSDKKDSSKVPTGRASRFGKLAALAGNVAGGMMAEGTRQLMSGKRPRARDLLLTPRNVGKVADQLAQMRGAAMKVGQLLSMDAGELLPKELSDILAKLRADASPMPVTQLEKVLADAWGSEWIRRFEKFHTRPMAAASIGQVHEARSLDGERLAVKIQYPGVRQSIDSDVDNVAALLRTTGLMPSHMDIKPLLAEAKKQLQDEADYLTEAEYLGDYRTALGEDDRYLMPSVDISLTTRDILVMSYVDGAPVESLIDSPQEARDAYCAALFELLFRELFEFRLVQTDPNFGNYRVSDDLRPVLLDFGACRRYSKKVSDAYRRLLKAAIAGDRVKLEKAATTIGYFQKDLPDEHKATILSVFELACEPVTAGEPYDFARSDLATRLRNLGMDIFEQRELWHTPPADAIFLHRKLGGLYLLAARMKAKVDVTALAAPWL